MFILFILTLVYINNNVIAINLHHTNSTEKVIYDLDRAEFIFKEYIQVYKKKYTSKDDYDYRFGVFRDNLKKINELNVAYPKTIFGITQFTDVTHEEVVKNYMGYRANGSKQNVEPYVPNGTAPDSLDWRTKGVVTEVKNQYNCGSCYVFGAIGNIEGQHAIKHGELISLSEQQGLDCDNQDLGCHGGEPVNVMNALAQQGGSMREEDYPYVKSKGTCNTVADKIVVKVISGKDFPQLNEDDLADAVSNTGPLAVGVHASYEMEHYHGGVFRPVDCSGGINHEVLLVGYGTDTDGTPYWIIKNSWGAVWGEQGYIRLIRGVQACSIGLSVTTAEVA